MRLLFAGYGPVHFICFRPAYERLREIPGIEVWFSGGREIRKSDKTVEYDTPALYRKFDVPRDRILELPQMRRRKFDMVFSAHTKGFFPRRRCTRVQMFHGARSRNWGMERL